MAFFKQAKSISFLIAVILIATGFHFAFAESGFSKASDRISRSWPGEPSNHLFTFRTHTAIPGSGKIEISFDESSFMIPAELDYIDVDLAVADDISGPYSNRGLSGVLGGGNDMVETSTGSPNSLSITLDPSSPIPAGKYVEIKVGNNSFYGGSGSHQIINPSAISSYKIFIRSMNDSGTLLDRTEIMTAIVESVHASISIGRIRGNGRPNGSLVGGTTQTIMSLTTNLTATCTYSNIVGTDYDSMTEQFTNTGNIYHSVLIGGLTNATWYSFYVRCLWPGGYKDIDDYEIRFYVAAPGSEGTGGGTGDGGGAGDDTGVGTGDVPGSGNNSGGNDGPGSGGGSGGGGGGGGGSSSGQINTLLNTGESGIYPFEDQIPPNVTIKGLAYSNSQVYILKDGILNKTITADSAGKFTADIGGLKEGVYTFNIWALDSDNRKSITKSTTFWIKENTKTMTEIFLPPTIEINRNTLKLGDILTVYGQSLPSSKVQVWFDTSLKNLVKKETQSAVNGKWSLDFNTGELKANGNYYVRARTLDAVKGYSDFSANLNFGIGQAPSGPLNTCQRADINKDTKVNLIDFSILLYNWGKSTESADINLDGKINLVDFSLMMYCWTG